MASSLNENPEPWPLRVRTSTLPVVKRGKSARCAAGSSPCESAALGEEDLLQTARAAAQSKALAVPPASAYPPCYAVSQRAIAAAGFAPCESVVALARAGLRARAMHPPKRTVVASVARQGIGRCPDWAIVEPTTMRRKAESVLCGILVGVAAAWSQAAAVSPR